MRVLLSAIGSRGDVQPLVALATQLRAAGQEARLCVPPDFRDWVESFGFPVTPIGPRVQQLRRAGASVSDKRLREVAEATLADRFTTITAAARGCDVIVAMAQQVATRSVAQALGIGYVYVTASPVVLPSPHHAPPPLPATSEDQPPPGAGNSELWSWHAECLHFVFGPALNRQRAMVGLEPVDDVLSHVLTSQPWLAADPVLAPWPGPTVLARGDDPPEPPAEDAVFQSGAWILPDDRRLSRELEAFLQAGEPPVYFGFGSTLMPPGLDRVIIAAARRSGRRAVISAGWAGLTLTDREPDCLVIGEVNVQRLFAQVAAVVHHGGASTTATAALAGVPQVVIPQAADQYYWAQRVSDLGIGIAHAPGMPTADSLTAALDHALAPGVAARARSTSLAMRGDGAQLAAENLIASLARSNAR
jgi:vancomycin aglycone glucosyltransferase